MNCPKCGKTNKTSATFCTSCGGRLSDSSEVFRASGATTPQPASPFPAPVSLRGGRYRILKSLGAGGMGRVFLAEDTDMEAQVVVKEMLPFYTTPEEKDYLEKRFKEEAKILFRMKHQHLPRVMDYFTENNSQFLVMEYVTGKNLEELAETRPHNRITVEEAIEWMDSVLDILGYLHSQTPPIIHRDIKPGNIMLTDKKDIFIVDFGVARPVGKGTYTSVGSPGFASMDHYTGHFSPSSDVFSVGATFHFLLSGDSPLNRQPFDFPPLSQYRGDIPPALEKIFSKMLAVKAEDRYKTTAEIRRDLKNLKKDQKPTPPPEKKTKPKQEPKQESKSTRPIPDDSRDPAVPPPKKDTPAPTPPQEDTPVKEEQKRGTIQPQEISPPKAPPPPVKKFPLVPILGGIALLFLLMMAGAFILLPKLLGGVIDEIKTEILGKSPSPVPSASYSPSPSPSVSPTGPVIIAISPTLSPSREIDRSKVYFDLDADLDSDKIIEKAFIYCPDSPDPYSQGEKYFIIEKAGRVVYRLDLGRGAFSTEPHLYGGYPVGIHLQNYPPTDLPYPVIMIVYVPNSGELTLIQFDGNTGTYQLLSMDEGE